MSDSVDVKVELVPNTRQAAKFSAPDADLTFQSSDGVLFKVHRANLTTHSHVFPGREVQDDGEPVRLEENAEVLELLLQHIYPDPAPELDGTPFATICALAEAAEKYQLVLAMEICRLHLKQRHQEDPSAVLQYACKHEYNSLSNLCAKYTLDRSPQDMLALLGAQDFARWSIYRERWTTLRSWFQDRITYISAHMAPGQDWHNNMCSTRISRSSGSYFNAPTGIYRSPSLSDLCNCESLLATIRAGADPCSSCDDSWTALATDLTRAVQSIPAFSVPDHVQ